MKQLLKHVGFALLMVSATLAVSSCNNNKAAENEQLTEVYACPMDCEKGKTYSEPGQCPVCEMDLQLVTEQ